MNLLVFYDNVLVFFLKSLKLKQFKIACVSVCIKHSSSQSSFLLCVSHPLLFTLESVYPFALLCERKINYIKVCCHPWIFFLWFGQFVIIIKEYWHNLLSRAEIEMSSLVLWMNYIFEASLSSFTLIASLCYLTSW
jgi:hypothetical protein